MLVAQGVSRPPKIARRFSEFRPQFFERPLDVKGHTFWNTLREGDVRHQYPQAGGRVAIVRCRLGHREIEVGSRATGADLDGFASIGANFLGFKVATA